MNYRSLYERWVEDVDDYVLTYCVLTYNTTDWLEICKNTIWFKFRAIQIEEQNDEFTLA